MLTLLCIETNQLSNQDLFASLMLMEYLQLNQLNHENRFRSIGSSSQLSLYIEFQHLTISNRSCLDFTTHTPNRIWPRMQLRFIRIHQEEEIC